MVTIRSNDIVVSRQIVHLPTTENELKNSVRNGLPAALQNQAMSSLRKYDADFEQFIDLPLDYSYSDMADKDQFEISLVSSSSVLSTKIHVNVCKSILCEKTSNKELKEDVVVMAF